MPELTGAQIHDLQQALLSAYPDISSLRQLIAMRLNENLSAIVLESDLKGTIFELIKWAQSQGRLHELVHEARRHNPGNAELRRLATPKDSQAIRRYLQQVIDATAAYIAKRRPVELDAEETPSALQPLIDWSDRDFSPVAPASETVQPAPPPTFHSFAEAFEACERRMILLGQPGAGKSTTLQSFAHTAAKDRLNDPTLPIPAVVFLHRIKEIRFAELPRGELPNLLQRTAANGTELLSGLPLLYILDGLDEMEGERPINPAHPDGDRFDPRAEFLTCLQQQLPDEPLTISCRITDYDQIGQKLDLPGAIKLLPLSDSKIREFLVENRDQPHLWSALEADPALLDLARTPLLLGLLSMAVGDNTAPINIQSAGDLINFYIDNRYHHEAARHATDFTLIETKSLLRTIAKRMWADPWKPKRSLPIGEIGRLLKDQKPGFIAFARRLHLLIQPSDRASLEFPHLAFRDHLAIPALIATLGEADAVMRRSAAYALGRIGPAVAEVVPALIAALQDAKEGVGRSVARALGRIGPAATRDLITALQEGEVDVRRYAAYAIGIIGPASTEAIPALIIALGDAEAVVRGSSATALSKIGPAGTGAVPALIATLKDEEVYVREAAAYALGDIGPAATEAIPALITALGAAETVVRGSSATALGKIGRAAIPNLITALGAAEADVRGTAATALGKIGPAAAVAIPNLLATLRDKDTYVRAAAEQAIAHIEARPNPTE